MASADEYDLGDYMIDPALEVRVIPGDVGKPLLHPPIDIIKNVAASCFDYIVESGRGLPRIETTLFPEAIQSSTMSSLSAVEIGEDWVAKLLNSAEHVMAQNCPNIEVYLELYAPYSDLLSGKEAEDISLFIHNSKNNIRFLEPPEME